MSLTAVGCSGGTTAAHPGRDQLGSPLDATTSWFTAINAKKGAATLAHFSANAGVRSAWTTDPAGWPTFTGVNCRSAQSTANEATMTCTFHESDLPDAGNVDDFWDVHLVRHGDTWLIDDYGQG
jgi:hypothetical protein